LQAGAAVVASSVYDGARAVGEAVSHALEPLAVFPTSAFNSALFWVVVLLFVYNFIILSPRQ
jgi:hypothetical protein